MTPFIPGGAAPAAALALAAGVQAEPQTLVTGGVKATGTFVFGANPSEDDTISIDGVTFTFKAEPEGDYEIDIKASLALTLDEMLVVLAAVDEVGDIIVFTENGSNTLTLTARKRTADMNAVALAASAATPSAAAMAGGVTAEVDLKRKTTILAPTAGTDQAFDMADGVEGQEHVFFVTSKGSGDAIVYYNAADELTFDTASQSAVVQFLGGDWRVMLEPVAAP